MMRAVRRRPPDNTLTVVSACDPLNLVGILTPGARATALLGNRVVYRDGVPVATVQTGKLTWRVEADEPTRSAVVEALTGMPHAIAPLRRGTRRGVAASGRLV